MSYKNKVKQRETTRERVRRYRQEKKALLKRIVPRLKDVTPVNIPIVTPTHSKSVPYPTNPTLKQSREWEDYKDKLRKQ